MKTACFSQAKKKESPHESSRPRAQATLPLFIVSVYVRKMSGALPSDSPFVPSI